MRFIFVLFSLILLATQSAHAAETIVKIEQTQLPALIEADSLYYDQPGNRAIARGNVRVVQGARVLRAEEIIYYTATNYVEASGNISLIEPDGNIFYAQKAKLRDDLQVGVIDQFRARMLDNTLLAATEGERVNSTTTNLKNVVFSPCPLCKEDPMKAPLWQLKAKTATIDEKAQQVRYKHLFFETMGVPIFYMPRFSHATPGADNKSGFLVPSYRFGSKLGNTYTVPYFQSFGPNMDATLTPMFIDKTATVYQGEFRHMLDSGTYRMRGSITNPYKVNDKNDRIGDKFWRGHSEVSANFMPTEDWHAAFDSKRSSDAEYLRKYRLGQEDYLVTHAYAETANQNNYTIVRGLTFQGLRSTDRASTTPVILPQADMYLESERAEDDSYWSLRNNLMMLSRQQGTDSNRISSTAEWTKPYVSDSGHMFEWRNSLRGDGYFVDDVTDDLRVSQRGSLDGTVGRMIPQAELGWRYPLIRQRGEILPQIVLEPMLNVIASPYGGNPRKIPNEDSRSVEYSDDNLFNANHFTGFDRVESGPRSNYGVRGTLNTENQGSVNFLVGQNLRTKEDENFPRSSGLQDRTSDYVARLGYRTPQAFDVSYRTRIDKDNGEMHRHDVTGSMALDPLQISTNYLYLDQEFAEIVTQDPNREELSGWATLALTEEWSLTSSLRRDMAEGKYRGGSYGVMYNGPCVMMLLSLNRDFTRTQEVAPTADVTFQILFKSLNWNSQAPPRMNINSQGGLCTTEYCY